MENLLQKAHITCADTYHNQMRITLNWQLLREKKVRITRCATTALLCSFGTPYHDERWPEFLDLRS